MIRFREHISEYDLYCEALDALQAGRLDEFGLPSFIKDKIDFVNQLATTLKTDISELTNLFKEKVVFKFFNTVKWSFEKLFTILNKGFEAYRSVMKVISDYIAKTKVAKWTEDKLKALDSYLQNHPHLKRLGGLAVGGILIYIWFNMSFTGDFSYDMGMDDIINAIMGEYTLSTLFAGPDGIKLLTLFVTGVIGLSFPWPGPQSLQFIGGIIGSLSKMLHKKIHMRV